MPGRFDPENYVTVQERINKFWNENPSGLILTELVSNPSEFNQVVFRATVIKSRDTATNPSSLVPDATGYAAEERSEERGANQTSWHENAETSAIGRALANMGYATTPEQRPSREEMEKVQRLSGQQQPPPPPWAGESGEPPPNPGREYDSPQQRSFTQPPPSPPSGPAPSPQRTQSGPWSAGDGITDAQKRKILGHVARGELTRDDLSSILAQVGGGANDVEELTKSNASRVIDVIMEGLGR